ncbi:hypothetical protein Micbo1qcDRAFT_174393 [Microdochium bolleyi]|uniref:F-box domain-containing protein n=1 Tax=Microdochium bolleyi TaxID=196109 RepID=A0A136J854_9PEZI|nr:hypothetical protein Micbo1qcDRAFT_174393 [Microdochium bolleyi]
MARIIFVSLLLVNIAVTIAIALIMANPRIRRETSPDLARLLPCWMRTGFLAKLAQSAPAMAAQPVNDLEKDEAPWVVDTRVDETKMRKQIITEEEVRYETTAKDSASGEASAGESNTTKREDLIKENSERWNKNILYELPPELVENIISFLTPSGKHALVQALRPLTSHVVSHAHRQPPACARWDYKATYEALWLISKHRPEIYPCGRCLKLHRVVTYHRRDHHHGNDSTLRNHPLVVNDPLSQRMHEVDVDHDIFHVLLLPKCERLHRQGKLSIWEYLRYKNYFVPMSISLEKLFPPGGYHAHYFDPRQPVPSIRFETRLAYATPPPPDTVFTSFDIRHITGKGPTLARDELRKLPMRVMNKCSLVARALNQGFVAIRSLYGGGANYSQQMSHGICPHIAFELPVPRLAAQRMYNDGATVAVQVDEVLHPRACATRRCGSCFHCPTEFEIRYRDTDALYSSVEITLWRDFGPAENQPTALIYGQHTDPNPQPADVGFRDRSIRVMYETGSLPSRLGTFYENRC